MRRASVLLSVLFVVAAPVAACGDTGDSKLSNGQDLPPGTQVDGGVDGTVAQQNDDGGDGTDTGSAGDPDTGAAPQDSGTKQKDSGSSVDSGHD